MDKEVLRMGKTPFCNAILHKCDEGGDIVMNFVKKLSDKQ